MPECAPLQAPAEEPAAVEEEEEEPSAPASSRFDYDSMVKPAAPTRDTTSAPKRGKDGHLTLDTEGVRRSPLKTQCLAVQIVPCKCRSPQICHTPR